MNPQVCEDGAGQPRQFATTRWSLILSAANSQSEEQKARDALEELCRIYWRPVFVFVCRRGYSMEDAQDLTQDFFVKILERNWLQHADANRGRFRSLLLTSLQNSLVKAAEKAHTRKRGGDVEFYFLGRLDGRSAIAIIHLGSSARFIAGGAALRFSLGHDRGGTGASTSS